MLIDFLRRWLPVAVAVTVLSGTVYVVAQQVLRTGANDPQVQMAEDAAAEGVTVAGSGLPAVDMRTSLAPWMIVYGPDRREVGGSARLHGKLPDYPVSAFDFAPVGGRHEITWEPEPGVRAATVIVGFKGGWIVAGRSLRLVEERETLALELTLAGWLAALAATAATLVGFDFVARRLEEPDRHRPMEPHSRQ
jgi:hypothetical protein